MLESSQIITTFISRIFQEKNTRIDFRVCMPQFTKMDGETFERAVVDTLTSIIEKKGLRHDPTAAHAWPYKKAPGRAWQAMRAQGKAQKLTLRDAFSLAQFIGIPMSQLCAMVESMELQGETFRDPISKKAPGRPPKERKCKKQIEFSGESSLRIGEEDSAGDYEKVR